MDLGDHPLSESSTSFSISRTQQIYCMASMMVIELSAFSEGFAPCARHERRNQNAWRVGLRRLVPKEVGIGGGKYLRRLAPEGTDRLTSTSCP